ncbi:MAG TPA: response regulator [Thermoanaerobaculia bacterium]|nr:response regulator [Thermoanaerobaculia bacterium]
MALESQRAASVLIIDPDNAVRLLIEMVLRRAGYRTVSAGDLDTGRVLLNASSFAVIVRDLNLELAETSRSLQELAMTAPELLRRTVVVTTAPERAASAVRAGTVFDIVGKPFDIDKLVNAVGACARGSREVARAGSLNPASLERFVISVPSLQDVLSVPVTSQSEAALRAEMRRTLSALSSTLTDAASVEANNTRAAAFRAASTVAAQLASPAMANVASRRDH